MKKTMLWLKVIGLFLLLSSWGAENFWKRDAEEKLNQMEFITINSGIVSNSGNLEFLKYVVQNREDPKGLALSYRTQLESVVATATLLKRSGGFVPDEFIGRTKNLLNLVNEAYINGTSLEPKDINKNIRHEIVALEREGQGYFASFLITSRGWLKFASAAFVWMYILGSLLIICGVVCEYYSEGREN